MNLIKKLIEQSSLTEAQETKVKQKVNFSIYGSLTQKVIAQYKDVDSLDWDMQVEIEIVASIEAGRSGLSGVRVSVPDQKLEVGYKVTFLDDKQPEVMDFYEMEIKNCQVVFDSGNSKIEGNGFISLAPTSLEVREQQWELNVSIT